MDELKEVEIIKKCQNGAVENFEFLYNEYFEKIYNFIYFRVSHRETAEDLASLTFIKSLESINSFNADYGFFSSWLYKIARNNIIDHYRRKKEIDNIDDHTEIKAEDKTEYDLDIKYKFEKVDKYIKELTPEQREILIMRIWDQLSYREIAKIVGKSEENCKVIFSRCLKVIKEKSIFAFIFILLKML